MLPLMWLICAKKCSVANLQNKQWAGLGGGGLLHHLVS